MSFEGKGKMREVFESDFIADFYGLSFSFRHLIMRELQPLLRKPFLRSRIKRFSEVTFKCCQASSGEVTEFFQRQVEHIILFHKAHQVSFVRIFKIGQHTVNSRIDSSQNADGLGNLQVCEIFRERTLHFEIGDQRSKTTFEQWMIAITTDSRYRGDFYVTAVLIKVP